MHPHRHSTYLINLPFFVKGMSSVPYLNSINTRLQDYGPGSLPLRLKLSVLMCHMYGDKIAIIPMACFVITEYFIVAVSHFLTI